MPRNCHHQTSGKAGCQRVGSATALAFVLCLAACIAPGTGSPRGPGKGAAARPGYSLLFSPADWAYARVRAPGHPVRRGRLAERFELRPGDCGGSDCAGGRGRAQIIQDRGVSTAQPGRDFWAGWSFFNASIGALPAGDAPGPVIAEWKVRGTDPALFRIVQRRPETRERTACAPEVCAPLDADVVVELNGIAAAEGWGAERNHGRICRLFNMEKSRGRWVDIVVNTDFGSDGTGYLRVWIDGVLRCDHFGPLAVARKGAPTLRRGILAAGSVVSATGPMVVYFDEYREGRTRADVDPALREWAGLPPVD